MTTRTPILAAVCASALLAACATPATDTAEVRSEPVYRTGSNSPVKDPSANRVQTYKPDEAAPPRNMPMPRAGGGG